MFHCFITLPWRRDTHLLPRKGFLVAFIPFDLGNSINFIHLVTSGGSNSHTIYVSCSGRFIVPPGASFHLSYHFTVNSGRIAQCVEPWKSFRAKETSRVFHFPCRRISDNLFGCSYHGSFVGYSAFGLNRIIEDVSA